MRNLLWVFSLYEGDVGVAFISTIYYYYMYCMSLHSVCVLLQLRHKDEIEQIRKAGHDSLAVIVEQYKVGIQV